MKTKRWSVAVVMLTLCMPNSSLGLQGKPDDVTVFRIHFRVATAEEFINNCKAVENVDPVNKVVPLKDVQEVGLCLGAIGAFVDLDTLDSGIAKHPTHGWCVPDNASGAQLAKVIVKYGNDHPQELHLPAVVVVANAFLAAFPCG